MKIYAFYLFQVTPMYNSQEQVNKNQKAAKSENSEDDDYQRRA